MLKHRDQGSLFRPTFCVNVNLDPVIVDDWQQGVFFDEVGQKGITMRGNLIHFCPDGQQEVIFGILNGALGTHLECPPKICAKVTKNIPNEYYWFYFGNRLWIHSLPTWGMPHDLIRSVSVDSS